MADIDEINPMDAENAFEDMQAQATPVAPQVDPFSAIIPQHSSINPPLTPIPVIPEPTPEEAFIAQQEQETALPAPEQPDLFAQKKAEMIQQRSSSNSFLPGREPTDEEVLAELEKNQANYQKSLQEDEARKKQAVLDRKAEIDKRRDQMARAQALGITLPPNEELDALVEQAIIEEDNQKQIDVQNQQELEKAAQQALIPTNEDVRTATRDQRKQQAQIEAANQVAMEAQQREIAKQEKARDDIIREDEEIRKLDPQRVFKNNSTMGNIFLGLALAAEVGSNIAAGRSGEGLRVTKLLNQMVERDLEAQKADRDTALKIKNYALDKAKQKLAEMSAKTDNQLKLKKIQQIDAQMTLEQDKIQAERNRLKLIKSGSSQAIELLDDKQRQRVIQFPDGSFQLANNKFNAEKTNELARESLPTIQNIKEIQKLSEEMNRFNPLDPKRVAVKTRLINLVGNLRLPFTGPGILTDSERQELLKAIGDPTSVTSIPALSRKKLESTLRIVEDKLNSAYKIAGVNPPVDINQVNIQRAMKLPKIDTPEKAEKYLRKTNKWKE